MMAIEPVYTQGAPIETYYLGKIRRIETNWISPDKLRANQKPDSDGIVKAKITIPVFVTYSVGHEWADLSDVAWGYRHGEVIIPPRTLVEGFGFSSNNDLRPDYPYFHSTKKYWTVDKRTFPDGRVERVQEDDMGDDMGLDISKWDKTILRLLPQLPEHVLDVIDFAKL